MLHRSLKEDQRNGTTENDRLTLASRVRHLDVQPEYSRIDSEGEIQVSSPEELTQIADILRWATHIEILTIAWKPYVYIPTSWLEALQSTTSSIRKLYCDGLGLPDAEWRTLIAKWDRLRTVLVTHTSAEAQISPVDLLQVPDITFFNLPPRWHGDIPKDAANPGLKQVYLVISDDSNVEKGYREQFLSVQGRYLKTVYIAAEHSHAAINADTLPCMQQLAEHCPHLTNLIFIGPNMWTLPFECPLPPSITHLGLYSSKGQARDALWSHLFYSLCEMTGTDGQPLHLQVVRLLNPHLGTDLRMRLSRTKGELVYRYLAKIKYRLEDHDGWPIEFGPSVSGEPTGS
ncbi:hypothetical protein EWM64_g4825 [Hericium alpestre]|uniref:Uncharacterized protein n=1 Tax=Hericium alpestre TaxID=135208 RepID=A0A4Y9ZYR3_9AGAM|nr:hypothetical protein EWM64_g4825 [Hericium alpestre]